MKPKFYPVFLGEEDRKYAENVANGNGYCGQLRTKARILLALDENSGRARDQADIADVLKTSTSNIYQTSKSFYENGIEKTLSRKKRATPPVAPKVDGETEARIIALACSEAPQGYARWTLRLLEDTIALIEDIPDVSDNTIGRLLKKHHLSLT